MKLHHINIINALTLIALGLWGYLGSDDPSFTALIPVFAGLLLLVFTRGLRIGNKNIAHIVVILTFLLLIALVRPLFGGLIRNDYAAVLRVLAMMLTCSVALGYFVKSFLDARKNRKVS